MLWYKRVVAEQDKSRYTDYLRYNPASCGMPYRFSHEVEYLTEGRHVLVPGIGVISTYDGFITPVCITVAEMLAKEWEKSHYYQNHN
jgi:hypothetical protein